MRVLVVGANGQIGRILIDLMQNSSKHKPLAMVRNQKQVETFKEKGVETVVADLEGTVDDIAAAAEGCEAIAFTAGSGGKTGADKTLLVDLDGAVKTMEAAEKAGVGRFIIVSALQAHHRENWNQSIQPYYVAKHYADRVLLSSRLNYTIIRPGGLLNEPGTGKVTVAEDLTRGMIPREDVARVILACLDEPNTYCKAFDLVSGEFPVAEALKNITKE